MSWLTSEPSGIGRRCTSAAAVLRVRVAALVVGAMVFLELPAAQASAVYPPWTGDPPWAGVTCPSLTNLRCRG
ncbi:MAG TPA: hypothetical protein VME20_00215 [Acidimicrobiales bacterium]|nr:hypothetical protein [Acidimicrobiales bacterium]